ncbi:MAG: hypothetical protein GY780_15620 [bacterium]|nr:hypothetical protein [bacterium]
MTTSTKTEVKTCRLLYYGPENAGKRNNLSLIHQSLPAQMRLSLASADPERQIAFSMKTENDGDWQVLVQAMDAGKEKFPTAGLVTAPPFDGIIFVVSSRAIDLDRSLAAMEGLKNYLDAWGLDLMTVPMVIQYNGRDASDMLPVDRLESLLNPWGLLSFPASSTRNEGIRETLKSILGLSVNHLKTKNQSNQPVTPAAPPASNWANDQEVEVTTSNQSLGLEYGPPLPGNELGQIQQDREKEIYNQMNPPVVVPVKIPRRLLDTEGPIRLYLEIELTD